MYRKVYEKAFFLLILVTSFLSANAQVRTTGQISGTVTDPSGALVAGATITVTMPSTGFTQSVKANSEGQYSFPELQPGVYQLTASASGFAVTTYTDVLIEAARTKDLAIRMRVGQINEKVEVSAQGEVLETTTNTVATTIDPDQVQDLPLNGRDILPLAELVSGAQSGGDERFTTYNSLPNGSISITIDGMTANSQRYRTSTTGFFTFAPLRLGAFDEMTVSTTDLTADAGAEGSMQAQFVTKRGTNQFHGNAFWEAQNSFFNANTYTNNALGLPRPFQVLNNWGGSLGGPLWKDKIFFFVNFEGLNQKIPTPTTTDFLSPQAQTGVFTYIGTDNNQHTVNLLNLAAASGFPAAVNPQIAPMLSAINGYSLQGSVSPVSGLPYEQTVSFTGILPDSNRYPTVRLDFQITPKVALHSSFDMFWQNIGNEFVNYPGDPVKASGFKSTYYVQSNGIDWTISPRLVNQTTVGIQSNVELFNPGNGFNEFQGQGNFTINTANLVNQGVPLFQPVIPSFVLPVPRNNPVWVVSDNLTWTHDKHTFTFGGDLHIANSHELEINNPPTINLGVSSTDPVLSIFTTSNFPNINTQSDLPNAEALYAALTGRINYISGSSWVNTHTHQYQILGQGTNWEGQALGGMYFQDKWRATTHFALNFGFRWQMSGAVHNTDGLWTGPTLSDLYGPSTGLFQPGVLSANQNPQIHLRTNPYSGDFKEANPNLGFAWNPTFDEGFLQKLAGGDKMVIRGGFAISHYDEGWVPVESVTLFGNPGGTQAEFLSPGPGGFAPGSLSLGSPFTLDTSPATFTFPQPMSDFFDSFNPFTGISTVNPNIRVPYVESWNFGIQRKLPGNNVFEVNYVGNHAVHMWMTSDLNETNIFENGFLKEFQHAQQNLAACEAVASCNAPASGLGPSFADQGLAGQVPLPIFTAAFGGAGAAAGASNQLASFQGPPFVPFLQQGQAGAAANQLATQGGLSFLCNMVGTNLPPCNTFGISGPGPYPANFFQLNPYAAGGFLAELNDPGSSSYNGLQAQLRHQTGYGLFLNVNYTYSHALSNRYLGDYDTADSALVNYVTLRDPGLSRGPTPYDQRHTFRTFLTYQLPFGKGKAYKTGKSAVDNVIGGWTVGSVVTLQSGRNFKLQSGYNTFNYSNAYWPDASDSGVVLNGISVHELQSKIGLYPGPTPAEPKVFLPPSLLDSSGTANLSLLAPPAAGQLGDFVYLVGPKFFNTDISIVKSIPITERVKFNIYAEFLNAFNHPNWTVIDSYTPGSNNPAQYANINSSTFSALSNPDTGPPWSPRNIQFRLQVAF
jgi:hypothetical protein